MIGSSVGEQSVPLRVSVFVQPGKGSGADVLVGRLALSVKSLSEGESARHSVARLSLPGSEGDADRPRQLSDPRPLAPYILYEAFISRFRPAASGLRAWTRRQWFTAEDWLQHSNGIDFNKITATTKSCWPRRRPTPQPGDSAIHRMVELLANPGGGTPGENGALFPLVSLGALRRMSGSRSRREWGQGNV